jgi:hypothetical protein
MANRKSASIKWRSSASAPRLAAYIFLRRRGDAFGVIIIEKRRRENEMKIKRKYQTTA